MAKGDEQQIRDLVAEWMAATQAGDVDRVLSLMTDDVVFLVAGQPPMHKAAFDKASRAQAGKDGPRIEGTSDIEEIEVRGDVAFARNKLSMNVFPPGGAPPMKRAGYTLTVFEKKDGRWLLARDANLLVKVEG